GKPRAGGRRSPGSPLTKVAVDVGAPARRRPRQGPPATGRNANVQNELRGVSEWTAHGVAHALRLDPPCRGRRRARINNELRRRRRQPTPHRGATTHQEESCLSSSLTFSRWVAMKRVRTCS